MFLFGMFILALLTFIHRNRSGFEVISTFSPPPHRACDFHRTRRSIFLIQCVNKFQVTLFTI
ncbi:hypothetical protein ABNF65_18845 [Paenibacillus larvae]